MYCPHCGQEHPLGAVFCPKTGKNINIPDSLSASSDKSEEKQPFISDAQSLDDKKIGENDDTLQEFPIYQKQKNWRILIYGGGIVFLFGFVFFLALIIISLSKPKPEPMVFIPFEKPTESIFFGSQTTTSIILTSSETKTTSNSSELVFPSATPKILFSPEPTITPSMTSAPTPTPTPTPILNNTRINQKDGAVLIDIPAGEFLMGSEPEWDPYYWGAEGPAHKVYLDSYWVYQTEVTNAQYEACVAERACPIPAFNKSETVNDYFGNPKYSDYPVVFVSYSHAVSYCNWAGGKLPSEAQWEKAARGLGDGLFPWGNDLPNENLTNYCDVNCSESYRDKQNDDGYRDTAPVGSFPEGASYYGVYDMSGNVWEWVFDYFDAGYYQQSPYDNPRGPASSNTRVIRGGSYMNEETGLRVVARYYQNPTRTQSFLGFRCAINDN